MWHREGRRDRDKGESVEGLKGPPFHGRLGELAGVYVGQQHSRQRGQNSPSVSWECGRTERVTALGIQFERQAGVSICRPWYPPYKKF